MGASSGNSPELPNCGGVSKSSVAAVSKWDQVLLPLIYQYRFSCRIQGATLELCMLLVTRCDKTWFHAENMYQAGLPTL